MLRWVRAHGRRFYDFDGLDRFKTKFAPEEWEEIIAIDDRAPFSMRALWAIAAAFGGSSPVTLFAVVRTVQECDGDRASAAITVIGFCGAASSFRFGILS